MKGYIFDPLVLMGIRAGYNRPLDRHDFPHGTIPDSVAHEFPGVGELKRFANLTGVGGTAIAEDMREFTSTQKHPLGMCAYTKGGRMFRYCQAGAVDTVVGSLYQTAAPIANHLANTPPAVAVGATSFSYTPGATAGAANLYAEGFLNVSVTPGLGQVYRISGHPAISASTAFVLTLDPDDAIEVALTTSSRVGLHHNPFKNIIIHPSPATANVAGFPMAAITATYFGWVLTRGPVSALIVGTPAVNAPVIVSATVDGGVDVWTAAAQPTAITVGRVMQVGVAAETNMIYATLD